MKNKQIEIKLILLGETGVGKTSIINRFSYNAFYDKVESTLTTNYVSKDIKVYNKNIKLNLWDTIGQEKYRSLSTYFLKETEIVILVYSITSKKSFEELDYWYNLFVDNLGKDVILGVIGNKIDLIMNQEVSDKEGFDYAKEHNAIFSLISVKQNGVGIDNFIEKIVQKYLDSKVEDDFEILEVREKGIILSRKQIQEYGYNDEGCCGGKTKARKKKYDEIIKNNKGYIYSIFLGANNVGKTSLINRIKDNQYNQNEEHTLILNEIETEYTNDTMQIILKIYDVSNDEEIQNIEIIKKCQIFFLVYDLNNNQTLKQVETLIKDIHKYKKEKKDKKKVLIMIIGNKKDLADKKNIINNNKKKNNKDEGKDLSNKYKTLFFKVSALDDKEIKNIIGIAIESYINLS